jgi:putative oxidoreductase
MTSTHHIGLLVQRIGFSALMLTHGVPKLLKMIGGDFSFGDPLGIGSTTSLFLTVFAEVVCPLLIIIGFKTRLFSIPVIITMGVAAFIVHGADPLGRKELALLYMFAFLVIALVGPGKHSVDRR